VTERSTVEALVLRCLGESGPARPSALVHAVMEHQAGTSRREIREALRGLVDRGDVALTWYGELERPRNASR
jgi:hypothetical protein